MNIVIRITVVALALICFSQSSAKGPEVISTVDEVNYMDLSIQLVEALKKGKSGNEQVAIFTNSSLSDISSQISTDDLKLAFWINVYNGYIIHILAKHPEYYDDRSAFFNEPYIQIAGQIMSFADIEHGILRRGQKGWGLGYIGSIFSPKYQRRLRPSERDYKIHFGLNCGAKSCPPVATYTSENVHEQLCERQSSYLAQKTSYDTNNKKVITSTLLSWFRGDFGGKKGAKTILKKEGLIPSMDVALEFGPYDWSLDLDNFVD